MSWILDFMLENWRRFGKLIRLIRTPDYRQPLRRGVAAAIEHEAIISDLGVRSIVDVGAHHGQFAVLARHLYPQAQLHLFEPQPAECAELKQLFKNDAKVKIHQCAIGDASGVATLHQSARSDSSSLLPITSEQTKSFPGTQEVGQLQVQQYRLTDVVDLSAALRPLLLKIDVQGYELQVLSGCESALEQSVDFVYVECSMTELYLGQALADEVIRLLQRRGFRLRTIGNPVTARHGNFLLQGDFLFERSV